IRFLPHAELRGEPALFRRNAGPGRRAAQGTRHCGSRFRAHRKRARASRRPAFGRPETPAESRDRPARRTGDPAPRRADRGGRPAVAFLSARVDPLARRCGQDDRLHQSLHGGSRGDLRPRGDHRPRTRARFRRALRGDPGRLGPRRALHAADPPVAEGLMRRLLARSEKETLALSRDVLGLAVLFLMPAAFIVVMSLALSDVFKGGAARLTEFAVMAADPKLAERLVRGLSGDAFRSAPAPADEAGAREAVRRGTPSLVLVVPRDFERALGTPLDGKGTPPELTLLADPALPPTQLLAFRQRVLGVTLGLRVSALMRRAGIAADADALELKRVATLNVETIGRIARPSSVQQNVP